MLYRCMIRFPVLLEVKIELPFLAAMSLFVHVLLLPGLSSL